MEICTVPGCDRPVRGRLAICKMHHTRLIKYGRLHRILKDVGTGSSNSAGYIVLTVDGKRVYEHVLKAEKALGKKLPKGAVVHHLNNRPWDNRNENLVVCPSQNYHLLLHRRMKED
jgi:HNH endonuclease